MLKTLIVIGTVCLLSSVRTASAASSSGARASGSRASAAASAATAVLNEANLPKEAVSKTFSGTVTSKTVRVSTQGENSQLTVVDSRGTIYTFIITADTVITAKDGTKTTLDWIGFNDKVTVEYTSDRDDNKTAGSIKKISDFPREE